jgi:hypothetical protein
MWSSDISFFNCWIRVDESDRSSSPLDIIVISHKNRIRVDLASKVPLGVNRDELSDGCVVLFIVVMVGRGSY